MLWTSKKFIHFTSFIVFYVYNKFIIHSYRVPPPGGAVEAFGNLNPRLRGVGVATVIGGFIVAVYNVIVLGWSGIYFVNSFNPITNKVPWGEGQVEKFVTEYVLKVISERVNQRLLEVKTRFITVIKKVSCSDCKKPRAELMIKYCF